jgi:hypothetical protein
MSTEQSLVGAPGHEPVPSQVLAAVEAVHVLLYIRGSRTRPVQLLLLGSVPVRLYTDLVSLQLHSEDG